MASLEQNKQESFDLIQKRIDSMKVNTPLDNTQKAIDLLNSGDEINIEEDFAEVCNILRKGNETQKELEKLKLIIHLSQAGEKIDYNRTTVKVLQDDSGDDKIILRQNYENGLITGYKQYTLSNKGGKWYYTRFATK